MATPAPIETKPTEPISEASPSLVKKKSKSPLNPLANGLSVNPTQHRAIRFVSFMLEESKHEITPAEFLEEALARHFTFYQSKRGIEFPPKMLAELTAVGGLSGKATPEE